MEQRSARQREQEARFDEKRNTLCYTEKETHAYGTRSALCYTKEKHTLWGHKKAVWMASVRTAFSYRKKVY